jgi:acyl-[acyl carrier protein]--UDP-N-acetylglucosamine O-acyltransferase
MFKITKHYEENIIIGPYQSIKVGISIQSDKELEKENLIEYSSKLGRVAKELVKQELLALKTEHTKTDES